MIPNSAQHILARAIWLAGLAVTGILGVSCTTGGRPQPNAASTPSQPTPASNAILEQLERMPDWESAREGDLPRILNACRAISRYPVGEIRTAIVQYVQAHGYRDTDKLYVLIKVMFEFPETLARDNVVNGYHMLPDGNLTVTYAWPVYRNPQGGLELASCMAVYSGPGFPSIKAFDCCCASLKLRTGL